MQKRNRIITLLFFVLISGLIFPAVLYAKDNSKKFHATHAILQAFKNADLKCSIKDTGSISFVEVGFRGKNCTFTLRFVSDDDNDVKAITEDFARYPENKFQDGYLMMNELSRTYRFFKFTMDEEGSVYAQYDFPVSLSNDDIGKVAVEIALRCARIVDEVYPKIMKSIFK